MNIGALLSNKYALYGGGALLALGAAWMLGVFTPSESAPVESGGEAGAWAPSGLLPVNYSGGGGAAGALGADSGSSDTSYMDSLIGLEVMKNTSAEKVSLREIDATYATTMAATQAGLTASLDTNKALNLASFASIYASAAPVLTGKGVAAVAGNFSYGGETFSFDAARFYSGNPAFDARTVKTLTAYTGINRNVSPPVDGYASILPVTGAPSATSVGRTSTAVAPVGGAGFVAGREQTSLPNVGPGTPGPTGWRARRLADQSGKAQSALTPLA